jgi:hypothetical protein
MRMEREPRLRRMQLAAVIPATDAPRTLPRCLAAIESADAPPDEVVVVDEPPRALPSAARNLGAERTTAELLVFVDADVLVAPDAFRRIRAHFRDDPGLTAVFGSYDQRAATTTLTSRFRNLLHHHVHTRAAGPASTFWAGLGAVRRDAFEAAGGFDHRQRMLEDVELGMRLAEAGGRILLDPAIQGTHLKNWTFRQMVVTDFRDRGVPWVHLLLEHRDLPASLNLGWRERASAVTSCVAVLAVLRGRLRAALAACLLLIALNRPFYGVLRRSLGVVDAARSVPLHVAHHVAGVLAVPAGLVTYARRRRRRG